MLTDCTYGATVNGCYGGWPTDPWDWIISNGGVASEAANPYIRYVIEIHAVG